MFLYHNVCAFFNLPNILLEYFWFCIYGLWSWMSVCVMFFHFLKFWFVCSACLFSKEKEEAGVGLGKRRGGRIWKGELSPKFIAWIFNTFFEDLFKKDLCVSQICMTFQNNIMAIYLMLCYYSKLDHSRCLVCAWYRINNMLILWQNCCDVLCA